MLKGGRFFGGKFKKYKTVPGPAMFKSEVLVPDAKDRSRNLQTNFHHVHWLYSPSHTEFSFGELKEF